MKWINAKEMLPEKEGRYAVITEGSYNTSHPNILPFYKSEKGFWNEEYQYWATDHVEYWLKQDGDVERIVIKVQGGLVQDVYSTAENVDVLVVDQDCEDAPDWEDVDVPEHHVW